MASNFVGENPQVDVIPDLGPTLAVPDHIDHTNSIRDGLAATQQWLKDAVGSIRANGWVTAARIANGAVTDSKIASVAWSKLTGTPLVDSLRTRGTLAADTFIRAGSGTGNPFWSIQRYGGVLDAEGVAVVPHTIAGAAQRILDAKAWFKGPSGEMYPRSILYIDGVELAIHPFSDQPDDVDAARNRPWRGYILYTEDQASW